MTDATENKKRPTLKLLAITAFIGLIALVAWLSIQLVNNAPGAFTSLASIAESVNQQTSASDSLNESPVPLVVASNKTVINTQETIDLSWNTTQTPGSYTFSYVCAEGISIDIVDEASSFKNIACDTNYNIGNVDSLTLSVESEKNRFENIGYDISFLATSDTTPSVSGIASFMVINDTIEENAITQIQEETEEDNVLAIEDNTGTETVAPELETQEEVTTITEEEAITAVVTPPTPVFEQEFTFAIPTSNPNGRVDISTRFIATGVIVGNTFFPQIISRSENGAIQFEVKNFGTKTSEDWTFSVAMPNGSMYDSTIQQPLKPNERAVLTIGFSASETSQHIFTVTTEEESDQNPLNDRFVQAVNFVK